MILDEAGSGVLRESICNAGNVTLMDVDDHLYITACQARRYSLSSIGASRDRGLVAYSDIVWFPSEMHCIRFSWGRSLESFCTRWMIVDNAFIINT